jgi:high-affinity K+ transport system ATPase subunit B
METLQNNNVWEYFATVEALMKSHQLSLILDVVNPFISILSAELMFHIIFIDLIPLFRLLG